MIDPSERYGMMRVVESDLLDELTLTLKREFGEIRFCEVGVCGAGTTRGLYRRAKEIDCPVFGVGVDFECYRPNPTPGENYEFHGGDSMDMWKNIKHRDFNFLFVDGCHCVVHASQDFLNYSPFVRVGGYALFHDTALPTGKAAQEEWPQNHSYAGQPDGYLGVRDGLTKMGLLQGYRTDWQFVKELPSDGLMGMCLFRKLADL